MKRMACKRNIIILGSIVLISILIGVYFEITTASVAPLNILGENAKKTNMTVVIKNESNQNVDYAVTIENSKLKSGKLKKGSMQSVTAKYLSNAGDQLEIVINDEDGKFVCKSKPNLDIIPKHIYNPNIQYRVEAVFKENQLEVEQFTNVNGTEKSVD